MEKIEHTLRGELRQTIERLKGAGGAVVFEDYPGALEEDGQGDAGGDAVCLGEEREGTFEARHRLVSRVNCLAEALERVRAGDYGICKEDREDRDRKSRRLSQDVHSESRFPATSFGRVHPPGPFKGSGAYRIAGAAKSRENAATATR